MASEGTEPASARRLRDARERGQVPRSVLLAPALLWLALCGALYSSGASGYRALSAWLEAQLAASARGLPTASGVFAQLEAAGAWLAYGLVAALLVAWLIDYLQIGAVWARKRPAGEPAPLLRGWLSTGLLAAMGLAALAWAWPVALSLSWIAPGTPGDPLGAALERFGFVLALGLALVAAVDVVRSRARHLDNLRMTRRELLREQRETQGPLEARREQRRRGRRAASQETLAR